jgi:hypothetical protein
VVDTTVESDVEAEGQESHGDWYAPSWAYGSVPLDGRPSTSASQRPTVSSSGVARLIEPG